MKVFTLASSENWICDRFTSEWKNHNSDINTDNLFEADIIWLLADWCWDQMPPSILASKKVLASVHHITPSKFDSKALREWEVRDKFVDAYHVPCKKTYEQIKKLTTKPIFTFPFWVNQNMWTDEKNKKAELRKKYNLSEDAFLIGSFQRDTEGHDLISPKLEKGPDLFCDAIERFSQKLGNVEVVLAGWRRQYVMKRLKEAGISYHYSELPPFEEVNDLYNCLDLYIVSARFEGGPQAIVECAINKTPIISTDVGLASEILPEESIFIPGEELSAMSNIEKAYENVQQYLIPQGFEEYRKILEGLLK